MATTILVLSDTHHDYGRVLDLLEKRKDIDRIFHLGDNLRDAEDLESITGLLVDMVPGNCDWRSHGLSGEKIVEVEGCRFLLCHGHQYQVKYGLEGLARRASDGDVDVILFGHTHRAGIHEAGGCKLMNPGSPSEPRGAKPSYGLAVLEEGKVPDLAICFFEG